MAVVFHAVMINVICTLVFHGIRRIHWRRLYPDGIKLKTHLQENGDLAKGCKVEDRLSRIKKAVRRFEFLGKLQVGSGVIVFVAYVIASAVLMAPN